MTVMPTKPSDFFDVVGYEMVYFQPYARMIMSKNIFSVKEQNISVYPIACQPIVNMTTKEADVPDAKVQTFNVCVAHCPVAKQVLDFPEPYCPSLVKRRIHG